MWCGGLLEEEHSERDESCLAVRELPLVSVLSCPQLQSCCTIPEPRSEMISFNIK
jgi:hypothetical protein